MNARRLLRENGLGLAFLGLFVVTLIAQSAVGWALRNQELADHGMAAVGYLDFVTSSAFVVEVAENWQSEFLQFLTFILATVWLTQRGSPESKEPGSEGTGSDAEEMVGRHAVPGSPRWAVVGGIRRVAAENSLVLMMAAIFLLSWLAQSLAGAVLAAEEARQHGGEPPTWLEYLGSPDFWDRTLQNWQSEFLAVGAMVVFTIYLRQRGSSESKAVGMPHLKHPAAP